MLRHLSLILAAVGMLAARDIQFSTTEGTWMSVDVSPDGKTLVFDLLGDLYTLPVTGGLAKPILTGSAFESQPRFSPDGRQLAFTSDRDGAINLWIANADGTSPRQLSKLKGANLFSPAWMPDGKSVLVSVIAPARMGSAELWKFPVDGAPGERLRAMTAPPPMLVSAPAAGAFGAVPTLDGAAIYFANVTPRVYNSRSGAASEIIRRDLMTGAEEVLTPRTDIAFKPAVSRDGKLLVYAAHWEEQTRFRVRNLETLRETWIPIAIQRDELEARATRDVLPNFAFTPDSKFLIAAYGGHFHRIEIASGRAQEIPFEARVSLSVTDRLDFPIALEQGPVRARISANPAMSPDGKRVAFSAFGRAYVTPADGVASPKRLTSIAHAREFQPAWSPDGTRLAYVTGHGVLDGEGRALTNESAYFHDIVWTPNGDGLVALRAMARDRPEDIVLLRDGRSTRIAPAEGFGHPHFAGGRLYVYSPQQGLISMKLDGSDRRTHLKAPGANEVQVAPDGVRVAARVDQSLYVFEMPSDASKPVAAAAVGKKVSTDGVDSIAWASSGTLTWALGSTFYREGGAPLSLKVEQPRVAPKGSTVLRGGRVITMRGNEIIADADIVVTGNRIAAVGKRGAVAIPAGAQIFNIAGQTVMPGLIDVHAHFSMPRGVPDTGTYEFAANLAYGVTAVREPQSFSNDIFVYSDLAEAGELLAPRIFSTGPGVFEQNRFSSYEEVKQVVARYKNHYRTHLLKSYLVGDRQVRQWVVQACRELGVMPTTEGGADFALNLTHAIDGFSGNEHALPTVPLSNDVVQLYARTGIDYTPTLIVAFGGPFPIFEYLAKENPMADQKLKQWFPPAALYNRVTTRLLWFGQNEYIYPQIAAGAAAIQKAGGSLAIGGHGELQGLQTHWEMWMLASGGMPNLEVLRSGTLQGARAIGLSRELGSIEPGKMADLIVLTKDPIKNIRNTTSLLYVMRDGELFDTETLGQLAPEKRQAVDKAWLR